MSGRNARQSAYQYLRKADPSLRSLLDELGEPDPFAADRLSGAGIDLFGSLVWQILRQGASDAAALQAHVRLRAAAGGRVIRPDSVPNADLSLLGISARKRRAISELARQVADEQLDLTQLHHESDAAIVSRLTGIPGIGDHTAQMFLIEQLHRPDVWPAGDVHILLALKALRHLRNLPSPQSAVQMGAVWAPYRSYAAALLREASRTHRHAHTS